MNITNGGIVTNTVGYVGYNAGGTGTVHVSGASQWTNTGSAFYTTVGGFGSGALYIQSGGTVTSVAANIASSSGGTGTVNVDGTNSTWSITGGGTNSRLYIGGGSTGTLNITNGGVVNSSGVQDNEIGPYAGTVTVDGTARSGSPIPLSSLATATAMAATER